MKLSARIWVPLALAAFVIFYAALYVSGLHSEGYRFLDSTIKKSSTIHQRVGDVQTVRLSLLGGYREKFVGSKKWLTMTLGVTGSHGAVTVKAAANKTEDGVWTVSDASIDGVPVSLN